MNEKVAMVVGGGSGMGAAAARRLALDGFRLAVLSSSGKGEALGNELGGIGMTGSNQSSKDLGRLVEVVLERWGRIDVLVNSAGHGPKGPVLELTDEQWHAGLEVYLLNVIRAARIVTPTMVAHGGGDDDGQYESALEREVGHQADARSGAEQRVRRLAQLSAEAHDFHAVPAGGIYAARRMLMARR